MKNFHSSAKLLVGAALVASVGAAGAMNIVQNGSFELGNFDGQGNGGGFPQVTGVGGNASPTKIANWVVTNNKLIWIDNLYGGPLQASDQNRFLDLTALTTGSANYATIAQTLTTVPNTFYTMTFDVGYSNAIAGSPHSATILISVAGSNPQQFNTTPVPNGASQWQTFSHTFMTTGAQTSLAIQFTGVQGDDYIGLDNVSVTAVPEPTSIAMLFAGLAAVGTVVARRRNQIS